MKRLSVRAAQGFKPLFKSAAPSRVRWALCPSLPFAGRAMRLMIGITDDNAVCRVAFMEGRRAASVLGEWQKEWRLTVFVRDKNAVAEIAGQVFGRAAGRLYLAGTPFQQAIWKQLTRIPMGKVISYGELARRARNPKAVRAAGSACGANPVPVLVPCHRVIAGGGGLGGFGGGLRMKKILLEAEGALPARAA